MDQLFYFHQFQNIIHTFSLFPQSPEPYGWKHIKEDICQYQMDTHKKRKCEMRFYNIM